MWALALVLASMNKVKFFFKGGRQRWNPDGSFYLHRIDLTTPVSPMRESFSHDPVEEPGSHLQQWELGRGEGRADWHAGPRVFLSVQNAIRTPTLTLHCLELTKHDV